MKPKYAVSLKLADVIITFQSKFPHMRPGKGELKYFFVQRYKPLVYRGRKTADILIDVHVVNKLPCPAGIKELFAAYHPDQRNANWRLSLYRGRYIYSCPLKEKEQIVFVNRRFNRCRAYLLVKKEIGSSWDVGELIYDFLQVLLVNYLAQRRTGIIAHAVAIKDTDGCGRLFAGKSGAGKSTTARIWRAHTRASVLNDDRVLIRKKKSGFFIYGSPWHGEFSDFLETCGEAALLDKVFFIYHAKKNTAKKISSLMALRHLYPSIIPCFWDKKLTANIIDFCGALAQEVSCWHFGFVNDKRAVSFIRGMKKR
jgi:hypothetical protein